ncbi:MAG: DUF2914 domain-containing protein [Ketobacteraceae bacterium]|nr:DUF2914 domain-containing protein [Ketobacteraceae bacterium]
MPTNNSPEYIYEYHWGRIALALVLIASLAIGTFYWWFMKPDPANPAAPQAVISSSETPPATGANQELRKTPGKESPPGIATAEAERVETPGDAPSRAIVTDSKPVSGTIVPESEAIESEAIEGDVVAARKVEKKSAAGVKAAADDEVVAKEATMAKTAVEVTSQRTLDKIKTSATTAAAKAPPPESSTRSKAELFTQAIKRARLTAQVEHLEPGKGLPTEYQGKPDELSKVYFYTEVLGQAGKTHYHRWYHNGKLAARVPIAIGSDRWRCYSSKYLTPKQAGEWEVQVTDAKGRLLAKSQFQFKGGL